MIHLLNGQDTMILDVIPEGNYWGDNHHRSLKSNLEKCEFMTHANKRFSPFLAERNRIIIPGEKPDSYREFIIFQAHKMKNNQMKVYGKASYLDDIKKSKVIRPEKTTPKTNVEHVKNALDKSIWLPGNIVYKGIRTLTIENYTNPFSFLKQVASEFDLELHFRIELEDYEVVRYVDMGEPTGVWRGREVEFGKDLLNISRKENTADIVTALIGVGPEREDGTRLEVLVEDKDALKRWGRNGQHLIAYYEPQSTDQNMTKERLRTLTENELEKRVKAVVEYESEIADLGNVPGLRNKEFYFGDQIKIKDTTFNPPLYLEARIHTMDRPFKRQSARKKVTLGDYKELTEEEVHAIWKSLQDQIRRKISQADLLERTYDKETIDQKDMPGNQAKDKLDAEVGLGTIETTTGAQEKANQAESNVKKFAVPKEVYEQKIIEISSDLADKAGLTYVDGMLADKANKADTYTKVQVDDALNNKVSVTEYSTDKNGIITSLNDQETRITQNEEEISFKASATELNQATQRISTAESQINVMAGKLEFKAESSEVNALGERVDSAEITIDGLKSEIEFKADRIDLEGFVTANDLRVRGDLEFGGTLTGSTVYINNPNIEREGNVGLRIQVAKWQENVDKPFKKTGHIDFNTLNNALEIRRYNEQGDEYALDGFSMHANVSAFYGDVRIGGGDKGGVPRLEFDVPARINRSSIRWNANASADYGLIVQVDGDNVASFVSKGNLKVNRIEPYDTLGLYIMSHPKGSIRCTDYNGWNNGNPRYVDVLAGDFVRQSTERSKDNIKKYEENALDKLDQSVIYQYTKNDKKEIGFILERETPDIIKREEGISGYSLDGLLVKSVQELSIFKDQHDDRINFLEMQVDTLRQELNNLKGVS